MKIKLSILFLIISFWCNAAARHWVGGTATWDGTAGSKWSLTAGGAGGQAVPTSSDDVFFDASSGAVTVTTFTNTSTCTCKTLDCTGFTGTLAANGTINAAGSVTFVSAMTITTTAGTPLLMVTTTATLTGNTKTWPYALTLSGAVTYTLADNWTVSGLLTCAASQTINGNTLTVGGLTISGNIQGTTNIVQTGGTWSQSAGSLKNNLTFNGTAITVSGSVSYGTGTITYTAATMTMTGSTLVISATGVTLNTSGMTWNNISTGAVTTTISSDLNIGGNLVETGSATINGAFNINISGNLTQSTFNLSGTSTIVLNGTGIWSGGTGVLSNNLTINTSGTITISGTVFFTGATFLYTTGTTNGASTPIISFSGASVVTMTLNSLFTFAGTISTANSTVFNGSNGFVISDFSAITAGKTITLQASNTYRMTHGIILTGTAASPISLVSSSGTYAIFYEDNGAPSQDIGFVIAINIDSSLGRTMWDYKGTLTSDINWQILGTPTTMGTPFVH